MTIAEILKANGIDDEGIKKIQEDMKTNKIFTASEENLDIRYGKLKTDHEGKLSELEQANNLIAEFKKTEKGNEGLQQKITDYESQIAQLQATLEQTKRDSAIQIALLNSGVKENMVDFFAFKLNSSGEEIALDDQGKIKGWDDKLSGLKTQFPSMFEGTGSKKIIENKLPPDDGKKDGLTKSDILKMPYAERAKLAQENPDAYSAAMN